MSKRFWRKTVLIVSALVVLTCGPSQTTAQETAAIKTAPAETTVVVGAVNAERLRISAPSAVVRLRLEVYDQMGTKIFDTEQRGGNVLDWHLEGGNGERVNDGSYLCVTTVKDMKGRLRQKLGRLTVDSKTAVLSAIKLTELAAPQAQAVGPIEGEDESLTVLADGESAPVTVLTNTGSEAQLARTSGALSFRLGDFFSGNDKEQMRLTEEGNLGIGTAKPKFKLDVAGAIRAREGLVFKDGSKLNVNDSGALTLTNSNGTVTPNATGTGTQNQLAKWNETGGAGTLTDSAVTEISGNVGIGTTNPSQTLEVMGTGTFTGNQTLPASTGVLNIATTVTNNNVNTSSLRIRNLFNGNFTNQQGLDVAPTFAPSSNINLARGFISAAFFSPPSGVNINTARGGNAVTVYGNTSGTVTNGEAFALDPPIKLGSLAPINQYGMHIYNQGQSGTSNSFGLFVDNQTGSVNNYSAIFAGGNVGIGTASPGSVLHVNGPPQPPPVSSGNGTSATTVFFVTGGPGGNTTDTNVSGGTGAGVILEAGNGGYGLGFSDLTHASGGGAGGSIALRGGIGGGGHCSLIPCEGTGGSISLEPGDGGFANSGAVLLGPFGGFVGIGNSTPNAKLQVTGGDVYVDTQSNGVILSATNGTNCYRLTVNNSGALSTALVTCP